MHGRRRGDRIDGVGRHGSWPGGTVDDRVKRSDAWLAEATRAIEPGCSAAAAIDGDVVWTGAGGLADIDTKRPLTNATWFDVARVRSVRRDRDPAGPGRRADPD